MKRSTYSASARKDQALRQLATPIPAWDGKAADVQLADWTAFARAHGLSVTRSFIAGESNGRLLVVVHVATSSS